MFISLHIIVIRVNYLNAAARWLYYKQPYVTALSKKNQLTLLKQHDRRIIDVRGLCRVVVHRVPIVVVVTRRRRRVATL